MGEPAADLSSLQSKLEKLEARREEKTRWRNTRLDGDGDEVGTARARRQLDEQIAARAEAAAAANLLGRDELRAALGLDAPATESTAAAESAELMHLVTDKL